MIEDIKLIFNAANNRYLLESLMLTLKFAFWILLVSLLVGIVLALLKTYGGKVFSAVVTVYVEIFRNTPMLLWLCVCFIALPIPNKYVRAAAGLTLVSTAAICEMVRGGLNSIHKGQIEAGRSQGLNTLQIVCIIVLPQCIRRIIPNLINQMVSVLKDTSYFGQIAMAEFLYTVKKTMATSSIYTGHSVLAMDAFIMFGFAALVYLVINIALSAIARVADRKLNAYL